MANRRLNPFGSTSFDSTDDNDQQPSTLLSGVTGAGAARPAAPANPFDLGDVDFSQVQKRRERALAEKQRKKQEEARALLSAMDAAVEPSAPAPVPALVSGDVVADDGGLAEIQTSDTVPLAAQGMQKAPAGRRPKVVTRTKTQGGSEYNPNKNQQNIINNIFSTLVGNERDSGIEDELDEPRETLIRIGQRKLAVWPYDDYHLVQKAYYEKLEDGVPAADQEEQAHVQEVVDNSSIPIFQRPADPPDIPTAVMGLPLTEFEGKAEERSIAIVSTWLFDAGLIDELLVNGGMTGTLLSGLRDDDADREEGVEIGASGFPIEGSTKMDKEIAKLRNATQRQLALINARLNDGVAATGSEVQELVNLVVATKDDIGRLRELSTYVSNPETVEESSQFMLANYPKLKQTVNARRNLARCFRELDFFSQIPSTCDRLREELTACEWTAHEWSTLRSVCREHVELEIFLVEAEAGMKKRFDEEEEEEERAQREAGMRGKKGKSKLDLDKLSDVGLDAHSKNELIDKFLSEHVENVWELGDEIRMRIMSGIATAFDLAMNNPGGMVALVEAVEVYETAHDEYKEVHGVEAGFESTTLRFTDMRAASLGELYKDLERRGLDIFSDLISQAADIAEEEEASNKQFSAVLRAANELTSEIGIVKEQVAPCFPPNWSIETLWTTCVAHVSSNNILQQIGGMDGQKLPDLTVTQLLDLVAWVETFREIIEETFPNIAEIASQRTYFEKAPQLLVDNGKSVDLEAAKDSLAWVNGILWDVHDLSKDEFLYRTKEQTEEWLDNVYEAEPTKTQTAEGRLVTSLCEDVYSLAGVQLRTIRDRLTRRSEALVQAVGVIFKNLYEKQLETRDRYCKDFEDCCAASNDFIRMSEKCEEIVSEIQEESNLSPEASETLEEQAAALLGLYSGDAVYAAQKTHVYIFQPIEEAIVEDLFGEEWQDGMTHNELALTLVRTLDDFMEDLENFLDEVMVQKCVEAQVSASVNFYAAVILQKSSEHTGKASSYFTDNKRAIDRMRGDIAVMRDYFEGLFDTYPTLSRVVENNFGLLDSIVEVFSIAAGISQSDIQDFVLLLQKTIKNFTITKFLVGDIYHLVNPADEHDVYEVIDGMETQMAAVAPNDEKAFSMAQNRMTVPGLRIDFNLAKHLDRADRKRPLQQTSLDKAEVAFRQWMGRSADKKEEEEDSYED